MHVWQVRVKYGMSSTPPAYNIYCWLITLHALQASDTPPAITVYPAWCLELDNPEALPRADETRARLNSEVCGSTKNPVRCLTAAALT